MLTNTAAATFSDDWDAEEPTVIDETPIRVRIDSDAYLVASSGTWAGVDEAELVAALRADPKATSSDLTAVTF